MNFRNLDAISVIACKKSRIDNKWNVLIYAHRKDYKNEKIEKYSFSFINAEFRRVIDFDR